MWCGCKSLKNKLLSDEKNVDLLLSSGRDRREWKDAMKAVVDKEKVSLQKYWKSWRKTVEDQSFNTTCERGI